MKIVKQSAELLWITPDPERQIAEAGWECYQNEPRDDPAAFIRRRLAERPTPHDSLLEHAVASVRLVTERGVTHELVRHRIPSYAQESTRWCGYDGERFGNEITVIEPPGLNDTVRMTWERGCGIAEDVYMSLRRHDVAPEIARSVLPTCLKATIRVTTNFREWRLIFRQRLSSRAHPQMRELMRMVHALLLPYSEACFGEFSEP